MHRSLLAVAAALAAVVATSTAALAATVAFQAPTAGSEVRGGTAPIVVRVDRALGESVSGVEVRLRSRTGDPLPGGRTVALECVDEEGCGGVGDLRETWGGVALAPDAAPFTDVDVCNGGYVLEARTTGAAGWAAATSVVLSADEVPAPRELAVASQGTSVTVRWTADDLPDVRHVVERRAGSGPWIERVELAPGDDAFAEQVAPGTYDYRVRAVRGDGLVDGDAAAPCTDDDRDLEALGGARTITVATGTSSSGRPAPTADDEPAPAAGDDATGGATGDADDVAEPEGDDGDRGGAGTTTAGRRVAPPPPAAGSQPRVRTPQLGARPDDGEGFFGEGSGFADELRYDGLSPVPGDAEPTFVQRLVPGAVASISTLDVDLRRILPSVAAGLVLTTLALHLRRWSRET